MAVLFIAGVAVVYANETVPNHAFARFGVDQLSGPDQAGGNMEGKEVRFGVAQSALFADVSTASSDGAVDAMHDSFMPLSGLVLMANMMLDEVIVGGPGSGLFGILLFVFVAVFAAGLMIGRTPEYLGKKIEANEVTMAMLALLCVPAFILGLTALAAVLPAGLAGLNNPGPHGFSEILYAYVSAAATNGSAFAGLTANTPFYNLTLAAGMFAGRFLVIVPVLAIAGSLAKNSASPLRQAPCRRPQLKRLDNEPLVHKTYGDSFEATDLEELLAERGVGRVVVTGAQTEECIRSTLHGALARGYDATLVSDAHTTEDMREWGFPVTPEQSIAYTNAYWSWAAAPGRKGSVASTAEVNFSAV